MAPSEIQVIQMPHLGIVNNRDLRSKLSGAGGSRSGFLVARIGQREAGALSFFETEMGRGCHLHELFVVPRCRRGVGTALVRKALEISAARGYRRISLLTRSLETANSSQRLRPWYGRKGFAPKALGDSTPAVRSGHER